MSNKDILYFRGINYFLSNFYLHDMVVNDRLSKTVEHAYQAAKTTNKLFIDQIYNSGSPNDAKRIGKKVKLRNDWDEIKLSIMEGLLRIKFSDETLRKMLISTEDAFLEEGNTWHDNYWGNCNCLDCVSIKGENHLGKLLMEIREEKHKEEKFKNLLKEE